MADLDPTKSGIDTTGNVEKHDGARHGSVQDKFRGSFAVVPGHQNDDASTKEGQIYSMNAIDPALDAKMRLVNDVRKPAKISCW